FEIHSLVEAARQQGEAANGMPGEAHGQRWRKRASGRIAVGAAVGGRIADWHHGLKPESATGQELAGSHVDERLRRSSVELPAGLQSLQQVWGKEGEAIAALRLSEEVWKVSRRCLSHPSVLEACLQLAAVVLRADGGLDEAAEAGE